MSYMNRTQTSCIKSRLTYNNVQHVNPGFHFWKDEAGLIAASTRPDSLCFVSGIHTVEGIAVDWMADNLYWTDDGPKKTISVARLEKASQTRKTLIEGKMTHPRAIIVDPLHG